MLIHLRVWWRFYVSFAFWWALQNFIPTALQGAATELGQTWYGYFTYFNGWVPMLLEWIKEAAQ